MAGFYLSVSTILLVTVLLGLYRVVRGPAPADRMIAAQLFGTAGIAVILLLGAAMDEPAAANVAVVFAILAALAVVVFVRCGGAFDDARQQGSEEGKGE